MRHSKRDRNTGRFHSVVESPLEGSDRIMNQFVPPIVQKPKAQPRIEASTGIASQGAEKSFDPIADEAG